MLPSFQSLVDESHLLTKVLRAASRSREKDAACGDAGAAGEARSASGAGCRAGARRRCSSLPSEEGAGKAARLTDAGGGLQNLPKELLAGIGEQFLDYPVWHCCQLGGVSAHLGKVYMDDALWQGLYDTRFCPTSRSLRRRVHLDTPASARARYAQLHGLEARFREGQYAASSLLEHSKQKQGLAVLDLRVAPASAADGAASRTAFAALRDGSVMVYDMDPARARHEGDGGQPGPAQAAPLRELRPQRPGGPAVCCLPLEPASGKPILVAGYALGRIGAWVLPGGPVCTPRSWEEAHQGRVSALAAPGGGGLLSASSDGLIKEWSLDGDRLGEMRTVLPGHRASVASVAAQPGGRHLFLSGGHDRTMCLWDVRAGTAVSRWQQKDWVTCVEFHPTQEGRILSSDKSVHQWDLRQPGAPPLCSSHRHRKLVSRFRLDPMRLASCSLDGTVKVSSLEEPGRRVASPNASPRSSPLLGPAPAPDELLRALSEEAGDVCTLTRRSDYVLSIDFDATSLLAGSVDGHVDVYDFSDKSSFRDAPPRLDSETPFKAGDEEVEMQMTGLQDIYN